MNIAGAAGAAGAAREKRSGGLIKGFTFATSHAFVSRLRAADCDSSIDYGGPVMYTWMIADRERKFI